LYSKVQKDKKSKINSSEIINLKRAVKIFIDGALSNFYIEKGLDQSAFRKEILWDDDVDMVFSMNQNYL